MYQHLLVPIDDSILSQATVEQAVAFARGQGARITFFHARADFGATSDGALLHAISPAAYAEGTAGVARGVLAKAEAAARAQGVACGSLVVTSRRIPDAILEAAHRQGCDLIFMASHGGRGLKRWLHGSVTHGVIDQAPIAVLVATVEANQSLNDEVRAIAILKDEHRSQAAVIRGLLHAVKLSHPDFSLLGAMLFYIETFPQRLHHPKEDRVLFRLLRQRTHECDVLMDELEQQHVQGLSDFAHLRELLALWSTGDIQAGCDFSAAAKSFAEAQWKHMAQEEEQLLPAAARHLTPADWSEVARAFTANQDPRMHQDMEDSYEMLFHRLMNLSSHSGGAPVDLLDR